MSAVLPVILLTLMPLVAPVAAGAEEPGPPTLTVSGTGQMAIRPDVAELRLGAVVEAEEAAQAQARVNAIMQGALQAIRDLGVADRAIRTSGLSLQPVYPPPTRPGTSVPDRRIIGYQASNTVVVRLTDLELVGRVIDAGIKAGANQVAGLSFQLQDDSEQRREALRRAVVDARGRAEAIVGAMQMRLVAVREVTEGGVRTSQPRMEFATRAAATTPVQPGEVRVDATVQITYVIGPDHHPED